MIVVAAAVGVSGWGVRTKIDLDPGWQFARVPAVTASTRAGRQGTDWKSQYNIANVNTGDARFDMSRATLESVKKAELASISSWSGALLPHTPWIRPIASTELWQGVTYYRRNLDLSSSQLRRHAELTLEGAMQESDVWLNGKWVGGRRGGYLPVVIDLSGRLGQHNELLVRLDNRDNPLFPPGKPQKQLDFIYGCGLYRNAYLTLASPLHITDPILENTPAGGGIYVTYPLVQPGEAVVRVRTQVRNSGPTGVAFVVDQTLLDANGRRVKEVSGDAKLDPSKVQTYREDIDVVNPKLWSPDHPNLYSLRTELKLNGRVVDRVTTTIGIRSVEVSRSRGFVLNGHPIELRGTNRHQDYPWVGVALPDRAQERDVVQIVKAGHNIVRLSHYPHSPAFMDACDKLGLMTIPCIPGWQFINRDPRFLNAVKQDIRDLIRRDRNHPSAVFWETSLNETYPPAALAREWHETAKSESLDGRVITAGDSTKGAPWDVAYNGWKDEDQTRPQSEVPDRPGYIREYGDYEFGGSYSSTRTRIGAGEAKMLQAAWNEVWSLNRYRPQRPWTMGQGTWAMFDDNGPWEFKISAWGLSDLFRRPKPAFYFFQSQACRTPMLNIAADWTAGSPKRDVVVFTNCDSADLFLNGTRIAHALPDRGKSTTYAQAKPFDGSNCDHLVHPPIVFRGVTFHPGELKVVGLLGGKAAAFDIVRTPGRPVAVKVWIDDLGVPTGGNDLVFARAALVDSKGVVCTDARDTLHATVSGSGILAGESNVETEMGIGSFLVRVPERGGKFSVSVTGNSGRGSVVGGR